MTPSRMPEEAVKKSSGIFFTALLFGMFFVLSTVPATAQDSGLTFTVNDTRDIGDPNTGDGRCDVETAAGEQCTLRAAIANANRHPGPDTVAFGLPGEGVRTLALTRALPNLEDATGSTTIDGYTQPGSSPNTDLLISNARILIQVEGNGADGFDGLQIVSSGNVVRGLALYNFDKAVVLAGSDARDNRLVGNFIGTDSAGRFRAPGDSEFSNGVHIAGGATGNAIGGPSVADRNVISGNAWMGVSLYNEGTNSNVIAGNLIGLTPAGDANLGNWAHGVDVNQGASYNVTGGSTSGARNVISGNRYSGVEISHGPNPTGNRVEGNFIGTGVTGNEGPSYASNGSSGVNIEDGAVETVVRNNVIGNNKGGGVKITNALTRDSMVVENRIGISPKGRAIRNGFNGVQISNNASGSQIGPGNVIAYNPVGVQLVDPDSVRNSIVGNSIFQNVGLGIDLGPLGTPNINDRRDPDMGSNERQNFPVLASAASFGGRTVVKGKLNSVPRTTYQLQFFSNPAGTNEGKTLVGVKKVTTGRTGDAAFSFRPAAMVKSGRNVTATATDPIGNTSELSNARRVQRGR